MNWAAIQDTIQTYLTDGWISSPGNPRTPIVYDNTVYEPIQGSPWLRASLRPLGRERVALTGSPATGQRRKGLLFLQIYVDANAGSASAQDYVDELDDLFREVILSGGIRFFEVTSMGQDTDGAWFFETLQLPFEQDTY